MGLFYNPVANIRKPAPAKGRDRRLTADEEKALFKACDSHSNPMLGWIARIALYTWMRAGEIKSLTRRHHYHVLSVFAVTDRKCIFILAPEHRLYPWPLR